METALSLFLAVVLATLAAGQSLAFLSPNISALSTDAKGWYYYTPGTAVTISWTTPFTSTSLIVFQARADDTWTWAVLTADNPQSTTTYAWSAEPVEQNGFGDKMYFAIENTDDISCDGCVVKSNVFYVKADGSSSSSSISSAGSSATTSPAASSGTAAVPIPAQSQGTTRDPSTGTSATQTHGSSSQTAEAAAAGSQQQSSQKHSTSRDVGLGVGLGVGLAILIALIVLLFLFLRRRREQKRQRVSYHPTGSGNWTQDATEQPTREAAQAAPAQSEMRDSGVLGSAGVFAGAAASAGESGSRQSELSQPSNPFRQSYAGSQMSHKSWIEPFEFEKPESRGQDGMSQLRQSMNVEDVRPDDASSEYSTTSPESPIGDASAVVFPSGKNGVASRQSDKSFEVGAGTDLSSLEGPPQRPHEAQPAQQYASRYADGRHWPLP